LKLDPCAGNRNSIFIGYNYREFIRSILTIDELARYKHDEK